MALPAAQSFASSLQRFTYVQTMSSSHVSGGYWLGGAAALTPHLVQGKNQVAFEHKGEHWPIVFIQPKSGFSGGWRQFAIDNGLKEGDVVVYEVINPKRLKLFFFRAQDYKGRNPPSNVHYPDASAINWNGRKQINTVDGRGRAAVTHRPSTSPGIRIKLHASRQPLAPPLPQMTQPLPPQSPQSPRQQCHGQQRQPPQPPPSQLRTERTQPPSRQQQARQHTPSPSPAAARQRQPPRHQGPPQLPQPPQPPLTIPEATGSGGVPRAGVSGGAAGDGSRKSSRVALKMRRLGYLAYSSPCVVLDTNGDGDVGCLQGEANGDIGVELDGKDAEGHAAADGGWGSKTGGGAHTRQKRHSSSGVGGAKRGVARGKGASSRLGVAGGGVRKQSGVEDAAAGTARHEASGSEELVGGVRKKKGGSGVQKGSHVLGKAGGGPQRRGLAAGRLAALKERGKQETGKWSSKEAGAKRKKLGQTTGDKKHGGKQKEEGRAGAGQKRKVDAALVEKAEEPEQLKFPARRRANVKPIQGKQLKLSGQELQDFWNISEPEYDFDELLHEIQSVAKAEVRPVVVDEENGTCIHAPQTLTISGSLGSGWTYDARTGYFPVRFVNRDGLYVRLEDGTEVVGCGS